MLRLLDLYCGAGGAAMGYYRAGFTEIVGVDIALQRHYPFTFIQGDALTYLGAHGHEFDLIHASPPCQRFSKTNAQSRARHPDWLSPTLQTLRTRQRPYVVENVPDAWSLMEARLVLCGTQFGLPIQRHRLFETYHRGIFPLMLSCNHGRRAIYITGTPRRHGHPRKDPPVATKRAAIGIDWMTTTELDQAIPPAYTEWIGTHYLRLLTREGA